MDRIVRLSLLTLGIFIGSVLVIVAGKFRDEPQEESLAVDGDGPYWLGSLAPVHGAEALQRPIAVAPEHGSEALEGEKNELDDDELRTRALERARRRAERITVAAASEAIDPDWGRATEQQIAERFAAKAPVGFELLSATCKTSLCIVEVATPSREASTRQKGWARLFGFMRSHAYHRGEAGDGFRTVVFLVREGHDLPE